MDFERIEYPHHFNSMALSSRILTAGFPATMVAAGTSCVTTAPAPTTAQAPIDTPFKIVAPAPIQASSAIDTGFSSSSIDLGCPVLAISLNCRCRSLGDRGWVRLSKMFTLCDINTRSPTRIWTADHSLVPGPMKHDWPIEISPPCPKTKSSPATSEYLPMRIRSLTPLAFRILAADNSEAFGANAHVARPASRRAQ
jgi:hypothetical protein